MAPSAWYLPCPIASCGAYWYSSPPDDEKIQEMKRDFDEHWNTYHLHTEEEWKDD